MFGKNGLASFMVFRNKDFILSTQNVKTFNQLNDDISYTAPVVTSPSMRRIYFLIGENTALYSDCILQNTLSKYSSAGYFEDEHIGPVYRHLGYKLNDLIKDKYNESV